MLRPRLVAGFVRVGFTLVIGLAATVSGLPPRTLTSREQAIREAAQVKDPAVRDQQLRVAIRVGLLAEAGDPLSPVFAYLVANERWLNPLPYTNILLEFDAADDNQWHRALSFLDDAELSRSPRGRRIEVYRAAILTGSVTLPRGSKLIRTNAIGAAAADGLEELQPLIEKYYGMQDEGSQRTHSLLEVKEQLRLRAGASNREEASKLAAERLAAMPNEEFDTRIREERPFGKIVLDLADFVCATNPFTKERNAGCTRMREIYGRQLERRGPVTNREASSAQSIQEADAERWLEYFAEHVGERSPAAVRQPQKVVR